MQISMLRGIKQEPGIITMEVGIQAVILPQKGDTSFGFFSHGNHRSHREEIYTLRYLNRSESQNLHARISNNNLVISVPP